MNLTDYTDKDAFIEACRELHSDEEDPELMFQDWESTIDNMIGESWINDILFDIILEFKECEIEALNIFLNETSNEYTDIKKLKDDFYDAYMGQYDTEEDFAEEIASDQIQEIPENLRYYFNYKLFARDLFMDGFSFTDGHVFRFC